MRFPASMTPEECRNLAAYFEEKAGIAEEKHPDNESILARCVRLRKLAMDLRKAADREQ